MRVAVIAALLGSLLLPAPALAGEKCVIRAVTVAEIASLATTPVLIVPAPGAGKALVPTRAQWLIGAGTDWTLDWPSEWGQAPVPILVLMSDEDNAMTFGDGPTWGLLGTYWLARGHAWADGDAALAESSPLYLGLVGAPFTGGTRSLRLRVCYDTVGVTF